MNKLEELIKEFCPNGVEYKRLSEVCEFNRGTSITSKDAQVGNIPVISGGQKPAFYHNVSNRPASTITVAGSGAYAGYVAIWDKPIFCADSFSVDIIDEEQLNKRYLYHYLLSKQSEIFAKKQGAGIPHVHGKDIASLQIPLPALPVQREIVRILDSFTLYSAELTAELTARRKQYEFYRDKLLSFDIRVQRKTIEEIAFFRRGSFPQPYTNGAFYGGEGAMPFVQVADVAESGFRLENDTKQTISLLAQPKSVFVHAGTIICSLQGSIGRVAIVQYDCYVDRTLAIFESFKIPINKKYFAYSIDRKFSYEKNFARGSTIKTITKEEFSKFEIPVPPMEVQERIVKVLDNFDAICSDLGIGLPAEIEKRQKQYEYYREKLLTFDGKYATILTERNGTERNGTERAGLIRLLQYVYGFALVRLGDIADYSTNRITAKSVDKNNYVGVDNLLADRQGKTESVYVPENGNLIEFRSENTLIGNIRPYLKKIWFANCDGGTNGDVLVIKANEDYVMPKYLYYVLSSDKFFAFDMQYAKGAKMPRGNKVAIMTYQFSLPTLEKQKEIVDILDKFDSLCNDLSAGLPAEIEHRQKQYEYYRDKLLSFQN